MPNVYEVHRLGFASAAGVLWLRPHSSSLPPAAVWRVFVLVLFRSEPTLLRGERLGEAARPLFSANPPYLVDGAGGAFPEL